MKQNNLFIVFYYDSNNDKYIEMTVTRNRKLAYECYNLLIEKYPDELYLVAKILEV